MFTFPATCFLLSSAVRLFRLGGTLTAAHLMCGWVEVQVLMAKDLSQTQFQAEAETKKKPQNKVGRLRACRQCGARKGEG